MVATRADAKLAAVANAYHGWSLHVLLQKQPAAQAVVNVPSACANANATTAAVAYRGCHLYVLLQKQPVSAHDIQRLAAFALNSNLCSSARS